MIEHALTAMITISIIAANSFAGSTTVCKIASIPDVAFSNAPISVVVEYSLSDEMASVHLHVELKGAGHDVYDSEAIEIQGAGQRAFEFQCPASQGELILFAAWMGEDWRDPLYPIQYSDPIPVLPQSAYQHSMAVENVTPGEIRQKLAALNYTRSSGRNVAIFAADVPGMDRQVIAHYERALSRAGFEVARISLDEPVDSAILSPEHFDFLMITDIRLFPSVFTFSLMRYLKGGGKLIAFGSPAFQERVWRSDGRWVTETSYAEALADVEPTRILLDFETGDLSGWHRGTPKPETRTDHRILPEGRNGGKCLRVDIHDFYGWDTFVYPLGAQVPQLQNSLTTFWAKGDENTKHIIVEWQEKDKSRWIATIELQTEWKKYVLTPFDFKYWSDNPSEGRGGQNDRLHPENAEIISFGVAHSFAPYNDGASYTYWVDELGIAPALGISPPPGYVLQLPIISPAYKLYRLGEVNELWHSEPYAEGDRPVGVSIEDAWFPMSRHHGGGFHRNRLKRFIQILDARHEDGTYRGSVCAMLLNIEKPWFPGAWVTVGAAEREALTSGAITDTIANAAKRMSEGIFLAEAGAEFYSYYPGEKMIAGAKVINISSSDRRASVKMTLHDQTGEKTVIIEEDLSAPLGAQASCQHQLKAPNAPDSEWFITTELTLDGKRIDMIQQRFSVLATPVDDKSEFITISGGDFYLKGEKWYPYGINYWPCYIAGDEPYKRFGRWYNPELIERDMVQMKAMGMNMISIQSTAFDESRDFLDLVSRAYRHGIRVNLFLHGSDPLRFDADTVAKQIKGWKLDSNPAIFAYDMAWEHKLGNYGSRRRWDGDWADWIQERYGNVDSAEADWNFAVPRSDGKITGPSDAQLTRDGDWRVMVAAYRRFVDDFISRKYKQAVEAVKEMAPDQLISVRMGYGGTGPCNPGVFPIDLRSVAKHLEFLSPEGWGMNGTREHVLAGGITTAYGDWASRGKPCFWCEWGMNVWNKSSMRPDQKRIEEQGKQYRYFSEMFLLSGANGQAAWWLPGGFRVGENSDFGILSPDASWRPACHAMKEWADKLKTSRDRPKPDRWITIDRDSHPGGYWHVYNSHKDEYAKAILDGHLAGIKTEGTNTTSENTPLLSVGNTQYNGSNPPKYLNAEFNSLEIKNADGQWVAVSDGDVVRVHPDKPLFVRASVGNIGEAKWLTPSGTGEKGAVYLSSRTADGFGLGAISADTPYLGDATVAPFALVNSVQERMIVEFEMTAYDRAWFGEKISVTLKPR